MLENTTFGSAFMSWPVALCELGHAFAMSWAARRPSTSSAGLAEQLGHRALAMLAVRLRVAEPLDHPVAASDEAVQRHRHVEDEPALRRLVAHASSFPPRGGYSAPIGAA